MSRTPILRASLIALAAGTFALGASAADYHVGASLGRSSYDIDTTGATRADTRGSASKFVLGATLMPNLAVEASLFSLGGARGTVDVPGSTTAVEASARVRGLSATAVLSAPVGPVNAFARAGLGHVRSRVQASVGSNALSASESSWQPIVGVGLSYDIDKRWAVRGEWERVRARLPGGDKVGIGAFSVGLTYQL